MNEIKKITDFRFLIGCSCYIMTPDKPILSTIDGVNIKLNEVICDEDKNLILERCAEFRDWSAKFFTFR